jgi:hypothetical protein
VKYPVWLFLILVFSGCAAHRMRGIESETIGGHRMANLKVTASVAKDLSIDQYELIDIYLRNLNPDWLRVKNVEILGVEGVERFHVIVGPDLKVWRKSINLDIDLRLETAKSQASRDQLNAQKTRLAEYSDDDHLYQSFSIPSQLQTRKWILFQFANKAAVKSFRFEVTWIDDQRQVFEVPLKKDAT